MATAREKATVHSQAARARMMGVKSTLTVADWLDIKARHQGKCAYCGQETELSPDHIHPITRGGENTPENINPACRPCNGSKQDKTLDEWQNGRPAPRLYGRALLNARLKNSAKNTLQ